MSLPCCGFVILRSARHLWGASGWHGVSISVSELDLLPYARKLFLKYHRKNFTTIANSIMAAGKDKVRESESNPCKNWSEKMLNLINRFDCTALMKHNYVPFVIRDVQVGLVPSQVLEVLKLHTDTFDIIHDTKSNTVSGVTLKANIDDTEECNGRFDDVLSKWRTADTFVSLRGWRNEKLSIRNHFSAPPLFYVERSACTLFGFKTYSIHLNGYMRTESGQIRMWIARRSKTKPTYPGQLDNTVAGQIAVDDGVMKTVIKECDEEASIPENIASLALPAGFLNYIIENERGIRPETIFVYDLELPSSFQPAAHDDEVSDFYLMSMDEVKEAISSVEFKPDSALVILDFLIRHGYIDPDTEPNFIDFAQGCKKQLPY